MTRITTFQAAGILVAALMCFSKVCYVDSKTTTGPTTTAASNVTATGPPTTAANNMTTTAPTTTTASNMTTTGPTTTAASNMTTTAPTTTTASNMTTSASNMTTTASNMTTTTSNMTTTASNMTTTEPTTAVTSGGTTPAPKVRWQVRDKDGKLCMLMDFGGTITNLVNGVTEQIPSDASTSKSNCSSSSYSAFVLNFNNIFTWWGIGLNFTTRGGSFKLHTLSANFGFATTSLSDSETGDFFDVPLGDYYTCSHFNYSLGGLFQLNLTNPSLQPFVQKTEGGDNLGQPHVCRSGHGNLIGIIVGVVIAITVIIAVIVVTFCVVKRRRNPSTPPYVRT